MNKMRLLLLTFSMLISSCLFAQDRPIGYWRAHMPYTQLEGVVTDGVTFYVATKESFFTYNAAADEITGYSKVEGMADVEMTAIAYDPATDIAVLGYKNTNIDLFIDGTFYNIPDILEAPINGVKEINQIYTENGMAYISTSFGIVALDLTKKETKETYSFTSNNKTIAIKSFISDDTYFYAATTSGLYRADKNQANLQAFTSWNLIDTHSSFTNTLRYNNTLLISNKDSVFTWENGSLNFFYDSPYEITGLSISPNGVYVGEYIGAPIFIGKVKTIGFDKVIKDSFSTRGKPIGILGLSGDDELYIADEFFGLTTYKNGQQQVSIKPEGPSGYGCFDIMPYNNDVWVAHGGYDRGWTYIYNLDGFSKFENNRWQSFTPGNTVPLYNTTDYIRLVRDPNDQSVYIGSLRFGLLHYQPDGTMTNLTSTSPKFEGNAGEPASYRISGLTFDNNGNLWINQYGAPHELLVKTKEGAYYNFAGAGARYSGASVIIDDYDQKWYLVPPQGVAVYRDNGTIDNPNDDAYAKLDVSNNLPSNNTFCIAKDKEGTLWVGTSDGIGIINCPGEAIEGNCGVEKRIVQYDNFAGYLFQGQTVLTIAVDGANRKWVGTTNGVWLISPSADKVIYRFTTDNSPLPSNIIQKIAIDPVSGDVYIGTDLGLISYKSTATEGGETNVNVITFPNPVPSGYNGTIAIKGLSANADVRITDISGQLIYRTKALGGQAVWDGRDYTGRRPQSGVYLIFATNSDGTQTYQGKMVFME